MSLQPVYKALKDEDTEIELQQIAIPSTESKSNSCVEEKCGDHCSKKDSDKSKCCEEGCKTKKASLGRRICGCICGLLLFGILLWVLAGVAVLSYAGIPTYRCLNPRYSDVTQYTFADAEVNSFDLSVVSGYIDVRTCPVAEKITLRLVNKAANPSLLNTMPVEKKLVNGVLTLSVLAPSFDMHNCQHTEMTLVIPQRLAGKQHLSLKAKTILGKIAIDTPHFTFEKVAAYANLGVIRARDVKTDGTFVAEAGAGRVAADHITAKTAELNSFFGAIDADSITSESTNIQVTGRARLSNLEGAEVIIKSDMGLVSGFNFKTPHLDAYVDYGRLTYISAPGWRGEFNVASPYGFLDVTQSHDVKSPTLYQNTPAVIAGSFEETGKKSEKPNKIDLKAKYAAVNFFVPK